MRPSEIEEALALGKCSPELLEQFKTTLRRIQKYLQRTAESSAVLFRSGGCNQS